MLRRGRCRIRGVLWEPLGGEGWRVLRVGRGGLRGYCEAVISIVLECLLLIAGLRSR